MGLYSPQTQKRVPLIGEDVGKRAYKVARRQLPQTENVFTQFKDGWHPAEVAEHNALVEWQWTKKAATLAFKNPRKDAIFYLDLDNPAAWIDQPQHVRISIGDRTIDEFTLTPKQEVLKKIPISAGAVRHRGSGRAVARRGQDVRAALLAAAKATGPA